MFAPPVQTRFPPNPAPSAPPAAEMANTVAYPTGPECEFLVGEGRYTLREEITLAKPAAHPSDTPVANPNPMSTEPRLVAGRCSFSLIKIGGPPSIVSNSLLIPRGPSAPSATSTTATTLSLTPPSLAAESASVQESTPEQASDNGTDADSGDSGGGGVPLASSMGEAELGSVSAAPSAGPAAEEPTAQDVQDVQEMASTSRLLAVPSAAPPAAERATERPTGRDASPKRRKPRSGMLNSGSSFFSRAIPHENLSKRLQSRPPDGVFAFANIDRSCQWLDLSSPTKQEYLIKMLFSRTQCLCHDINQISKTSSHVDVVMGFSTGDIVWFEPFSQRYSRINKNNAIHSSPVLDIKWMPGSDNLFMAAHKDGTIVIYDKEKDDAVLDPEAELGVGRNNTDDGSMDYNKRIHVIKSAESPNQKTNPVAVWKISTRAVNAIAFAPDNRHVAFACHNNTWRLVDYLNEEILHVFYSYFAPINCIAWSPDGKYVITGGDDDLVAIWSIADAALVARFQGHQSCVRSVAFDPWRCDDTSYRFGSVGEDCRLCLWEFSPGMVPRQSVPPPREGSANGTESAAGDGAPREAQVHWPVTRQRVPMPPPLLNKKVDSDPLEWICFTEEAIYTGAARGRLRVWDRPEAIPDD